MRWAPGESLDRWSTSVIADLRQGGVVRAPMRQVPRSRRRASVCRSGSGSRLVRNARDCHRVLAALAPGASTRSPPRQWFVSERLAPPYDPNPPHRRHARRDRRPLLHSPPPAPSCSVEGKCWLSLVASLLGWPSCGFAAGGSLRLWIGVRPSHLFLLSRTLFARLDRTMFVTPKAVVLSSIFAFFRHRIPPVMLSR